MESADVIATTKRWISSMVIGLNLCPFARGVFTTDRIRYVVSDAKDEQSLLEDLRTEINLLSDTPITEVETTILIHPQVLEDFLTYNDFLDSCDSLLAELDQDGVIQIASFHPDYQFADTAPEDVENYTNRSPYPMLHLLREESVTALDMDEDDLMEIPRRNIETLKAMGREVIEDRLREIRQGGGD